jgi:hypothetical protein
MTFLYLGSPYSDPDPQVQYNRYEIVLDAMAQIARYKIPVYCPIAVWHPVALSHNLPGDHEFWWAQDLAFMQSCRIAWFLVIPGHDESRGITAERATLREMKKPIWSVKPETLDWYCKDLLKAGAFQ